MNCTLATATLSEAFAETVTVPETVAPFAGAVMETVGGVLSLVFVVPKEKPRPVMVLPLPSTDCTLKKYSVLADRPVRVCEWLVVIVELLVVDDPRFAVLPYIT